MRRQHKVFCAVDVYRFATSDNFELWLAPPIESTPVIVHESSCTQTDTVLVEGAVFLEQNCIFVEDDDDAVSCAGIVPSDDEAETKTKTLLVGLLDAHDFGVVPVSSFVEFVV
jgi:hypothetical protein